MSQSTNESRGDISINEKKYKLASNWALLFFQSLESKINDADKTDSIGEKLNENEDSKSS